MSASNKPVNYARPPRMINISRSGLDLYLSPSRAAIAGYDRYKTMMESCVRELPSLDDRHVALACSLFIFEVPGSSADLQHMIRAALALDTTEEGILIYWCRNRRLHCRELSRETCALLRQVDRNAEYTLDSLVAKTKIQLGHWYRLPSVADPDAVVDWIVNDSFAWHREHLPNPLLADLIGEQPLEPLSASTLARRDRPALTAHNAPAPTRNGANLETIADAIAGALLLSEVKTRSTWLVDELLAAFGSRNRDAARAANHREREAIIRNVVKACRHLERCGAEVALVFSWAMFMLSEGTARTVSGNVQTVRLYLRNLARDLCDTLQRSPTHPLELRHEQWSAVIQGLLGASPSPTRRDAASALVKFIHMQLGVDLRALRVTVEEERSVKANVVWPHELSAAQSLVWKLESDPRLQRQVRTMLEIGYLAPVRICELALLRFDSVRVTYRDGVAYVEIRQAPGLAYHRGKSPAARRTMWSGLGSECPELMAWLKGQKEDGASLDNFLFEDPHRPGQLFRMGRSETLLHQLLKIVTGDTSISFHCLRHTVLTRLVDQALRMTDPIAAARRLTEIAELAGHKHPATTLQSYYHASWHALRFWIDEALTPLMRRPATMAAWAAAVDEELGSLARSGQRGMFEFVLQEGEGAGPQDDGSASESQLTLQKTRKVLNDIASGFKSSSVIRRCGISQAQLVELASSSWRLASSLTGGERHDVLGLGAQCLDETLERLNVAFFELAVDFGEPTLPVHQAVWAHLAAGTPAAAAAWTRCFHRGCLALQDRAVYEPLVQFLFDAHVPASHVAVRVASEGASGSAILQEQQDEALACVRAIFGADVVREPVAARRGRPAAYLLVARGVVVPECTTPPAACRMSEIHSAFITMSIRTLMYPSIH